MSGLGIQLETICEEVKYELGWMKSSYEAAVSLLQDIHRGILTAEDALRELEERVP